MTLRVAVVTGTRADLGLWMPVLDSLRSRGPAVDVGLLVMAMHLDPAFGNTVEQVRDSGVPIIGEVASSAHADTPSAMAASLGAAIQGVAPVIANHQPDWLVVLGDRGEQLAAALVALHERIAIAHIHGGERTHGAVDDVLRDLISRIAHLHLVATSGAEQRLADMGIAPWRIRRTGAPGLDAISSQAGGPSPDVRRRHGLPVSGPYLMLVLHPETGARALPPEQLAVAVLDGVAAHALPIVAIWPNADAGGRAIARRLEASSATFASLYQSLPHDEYICLLRGAAAIVGNSSSGIIEAPLLATPAVNVGDRQAGRERGDNVIDVPADAGAVRDGIARALIPDFRARLSGVSPYGDGHAAGRIADELLRTSIDDRLLGRDD